MLDDAHAFSSFSVDDVDTAERFYADVLGLDVERTPMGLWLRPGRPGGEGGTPATDVFVYPKGDAHRPASFTVLNLAVDDLEGVVAWLTRRGVTFERYEGIPADDDGIARGGDQGPDIAWFTDPAGNVVALLRR
ncbi:VOC family protein [Cellulomonas sp. S1-8]|uniref:VOC family protein n=1 Tax=Cellulomonas sp. S1-8 TaxID=2904790 RepID=UPI00224331EF|nr:VOC family protein [Cellulomonas sp. S1-8]UZN03958.1 VOC family protein [Cellulomonas sp. S1-8]